MESAETALGGVPGRHWGVSEDGRIECRICPRLCRLREGQRGLCFVRGRENSQMVLTTHGRSSGFCIDPIEKKPLNHFYPGTAVLSFGTAGCNLACKFCQNWDISKSRELDVLAHEASPETLARAAVELGCPSVAYTYNDPVIFLEYAVDVARACRESGIRNVAVTAGYILPDARREFFQDMDAANVDLKAFDEDFYFRLTGGHLQPVLDTLEYLVKETRVWVEITTLLIPGRNDSDDEIKRASEWIVSHLGVDVPWHFSAFHPDHKMTDVAPTPPDTLIRAREIALREGVHYVYTGNIHYKEGDATYCPGCKAKVIERDWYQIDAFHLIRGKCRFCGTPVPGRFADTPGAWGRKRVPVRISDYIS